MSEETKAIIRTLRLGNVALTVDNDLKSRCDTAIKQDNLLDLLEMSLKLETIKQSEN